MEWEHHDHINKEHLEILLEYQFFAIWGVLRARYQERQMICEQDKDILYEISIKGVLTCIKEVLQENSEHCEKRGSQILEINRNWQIFQILQFFVSA